MTTRTPMVMGAAGIPEQLQPGDDITVPTAQTQTRSRTNGNAGSLVRCTPVYLNGTANTVDKARANAMSTAQVNGLVYDASIATTASGAIATDGPMTATTSEWDAVTGQTGGLTPGSNYFLDPATAGKLTTTPPTTQGYVNMLVGQAASTTEMELNIGLPYKM